MRKIDYVPAIFIRHSTGSGNPLFLIQELDCRFRWNDE